ncbi:23S rRNA (guanosine(2251)-2'-O)-methyltransferase RlmB [Mycoplasmoides alvi]|uniref:23S rRNA (guanosine(2251)-2'-O)-methyltransferase RlmB n=1 Tax=Mycoplasmoides alvi TaxID=78580 RepID=UPI000A81136A|nr:23S rRNA (guanosine(2251)-2'-O)-methyltransferase RlmB [Mycoplasmoides alvi]
MTYKKNKISNSPIYLIGKKSVYDAIKNNLNIDLVCLLKQDKDIYSLAKQGNIKVEMHSINWFDTQIGKSVNHQGIVARVLTQNLHKSIDQLIDKVKDKDKSLILVLDEIMDPGNFGAILRTSLAANVDGIIYKNNNQAPINTHVVKASMGAIFYLDLVVVSNLRYAIQKLQNVGFWSVASYLGSGSENYKNINIDKMILIVGNEEKGISPILVKEADYRVHIPINSQIESLNVSVATGILLFQYSNLNK